MSENYILVAMATDFCNLRSFLEKVLKYPKIVWLFSLNLVAKNEPLLNNTSCGKTRSC